LLSSWPV